MIVNKQSGVMIAGPLAKDPEVKETKNGKIYFNLNVKAQSIQTETGKWESTFVDCNIWRNYERLDGLLSKGDFVIVFGRTLQRHPASSGKVYWSVDADGVFADSFVNARWVQMAIDLIPAEAPAPPQLTPTEEPTPFDPPPEPAPVQTTLDGGRMYPGEQLADYAPRSSPPAAGTPEADALIDDDADDLPF